MKPIENLNATQIYADIWVLIKKLNSRDQLFYMNIKYDLIIKDWGHGPENIQYWNEL